MGYEGWLVYFTLFLFWVESIRYDTWKQPETTTLKYKNLNEEENEIHDNSPTIHNEPAAIYAQVVLEEDGKEVR